MAENDHDLLLDLVKVTSTMCTVVDNAAVILSEEFEDMVRPQVDAVRAVLARCPVPEEWIWDGELHDADLKIEEFRADDQKVNEGPRGVKITHMPTGVSGESYSKSSQVQNREVVMTYLRRAVAKKMADRLPS